MSKDKLDLHEVPGGRLGFEALLVAIALPFHFWGIIVALVL